MEKLSLSTQLNPKAYLRIGLLAFAWITTASMAYISVMRGRILQHKEWMIRSYVVTFAFVTFRWLLCKTTPL
jgi:Predicted membrane protein (DUF2306)